MFSERTGRNWAWQLAGVAELKKGGHTIALHDLTGFNGRCDAVYITNSSEMPGSDPESIDRMRREHGWKEINEHADIYDLVVVGGGIAGICTALAAFRSGVSLALINDRSVLGGCNSSEVRVCMGGMLRCSPYPALGNIVKEIAPVMGHPKRKKNSKKASSFWGLAINTPCLMNGSSCYEARKSEIRSIKEAGEFKADIRRIPLAFSVFRGFSAGTEHNAQNVPA